MVRTAFALATAGSLVMAALPGASWVAVIDAPPSTIVRGLPDQYRRVALVPDEAIVAVGDRLAPGRVALAAVYDDQHLQNAHLFETAARFGYDGALGAVATDRPSAIDRSWDVVDLVLVADVDGCVYEALDVCRLEGQLSEAGFAVVDRWDGVDGTELRLWERS